MCLSNIIAGPQLKKGSHINRTLLKLGTLGHKLRCTLALVYFPFKHDTSTISVHPHLSFPILISFKVVEGIKEEVVVSPAHAFGII
ncbi:hypothetical protein L2E82_43835 [Cichorium intybus]|uniref:Uncharacterized protein n=1 Tax=Cichorium intybus TaxID=13427 RepID=A0ACB8ZPA5_CICIN|nr:hypothetical protein L2E82_43835 [Cichorium intybus]